MSDIQRLIDNLRAAVADKGRVPAYHDRIEARHRAEWPTLWRAIDALLEHPVRYAEEGRHDIPPSIGRRATP